MNLDTFLGHWGFHSDESAIIEGCITDNGHNFYTVAGNLFTKVSQDIGDVISGKLKQRPIQDIPRPEIRIFTQSVVQAVNEMLFKEHSDKFKKAYVEKQFANEVAYRVYVYWILKKLEKSGLDISQLDYKDVPQDLAQEMYNILQSKSLTTLFIVLKSAGILDYSSNPINEYEIEEELKILDIDIKKLTSKLEEIGAKKIFEWEIVDRYFDTEALDLDTNTNIWKRSLRIRTRITKDTEDTYYTIKRKVKWWDKGKKKTRSCYEKEFEIKECDHFEQILADMWLRNSRSKRKQRISYAIEIRLPEADKTEKVKFDIDTYEWIPSLVEIECESEKVTEYLIQKLGLTEHKTLSTGSRGLFRHYDIEDQYQKHYTEEEGIILWQS